jgi:hypothetical protein
MEIDWEACDAYTTQRWGTTFPDLLKDLWNRGWCDPHHTNYLRFSDLQWLDPTDLQNVHDPRKQLPGLLPIAKTDEQDLWCVAPNLRPGEPNLITFCPDEDEVAVILSNNFQDFLYRMMLQECSCTCRTDSLNHKRSQDDLIDQADVLTEVFPETWNERLRGVVSLPFVDHGHDYWGMISEQDVFDILAADSPFTLREEEFCHFIEDD